MSPLKHDAEAREFLAQLEHVLVTGPGMNVQLPPHLHPPYRSEPIDEGHGYEGFDRATMIPAVTGFRVPVGHRAVISMWGLGVDFNDNMATWTDPLYEVYFTLNGRRYDIHSSTGRIASTGAVSYLPQSENLVFYANEASSPIGPGTVTAGIGENPFGLHRMQRAQILLGEGDEFRMVYDGRAGAAGTNVNLYGRIVGWYWFEQEQPEGNIGR